MPVTVELPHVGESIVEGTIGRWLKQPGEKVKRYEPLVEVITDKVTMEVPSPVEGSLLRVLAEEGETVPMGAPIAEVETADAPAAAPVALPPPVGASYLLRDVTPVGPTGGAAIEAAEPTVDGAPPPAPVTTAAFQPPAATTAPVRTEAVPLAETDSGRRLSPAVRRLAREHSVDVNSITGTGMGGRVTRDDVLEYLKSGPPTTPAATAVTSPIAATGDEERVPVSPVRRMIAQAMVRSVTEIPHAWSLVEADVSGMVALRAKVRDEFERQEGVPLTYLPFVIKAVIEALKKVPTMNASWDGDAIILKKRINLGLAVAAPNGLIVPVIHDAGRLSLSGLAGAVNDLASRARSNRLTLDDVRGGTFTLNNTGALGSIISGPIINHPQAGIMTTDAIEKRPVVRADAIAIRSMMNLCLAFDHRVNDGAEASAFLAVVKDRLESLTPDSPVF